MLRRVLLASVVVGVVTGLFASPSASAQQTVNFFVGGFVPRALSSRETSDVLFQDSFDASAGFLVFNTQDFRGPTVGGEYLVGLTDRVDAGVSVGFYSRSTHAFDADFTNPDGSDIVSTLSLRMIPITATFRYLPLGHHDAFEPYIGAGVGIINWRYSESGDFVDSSNNSIYSGSFKASGTEVGPVILGGVRVPIGSAGVGGEIRYQRATGKLPADQFYPGATIDLGGVSYVFTISKRF